MIAAEQDLVGAPAIRRDAVIFPDDGIRLKLSRDWAPGPRALVIGCNPSDAGKDREDPTSRWWNRWFHHFGFGGYDAMNLYPFITSSPAECRRKADWHLTDDWHARDQLLMVNLPALIEAAKSAHQVFVCWGAIAWDATFIDHVVEELQTGVAPYPDLWCWGTTKHGAPMHPMARGKHRIDPLQAPILWKAVQ